MIQILVTVNDCMIYLFFLPFFLSSEKTDICVGNKIYLLSYLKFSLSKEYIIKY